MLGPCQPNEISAADKAVFDALVRRDHWVRRSLKHVDFVEMRQSVEKFHEISKGRPGVEPIVLIKLEVLMYHDNLSDTQFLRKPKPI
jgi:hypothetical protein